MKRRLGSFGFVRDCPPDPQRNSQRVCQAYAEWEKQQAIYDLKQQPSQTSRAGMTLTVDTISSSRGYDPVLDESVRREREQAALRQRQEAAEEGRRRIAEANRLNEESGTYFRAFHEEQSPYQRERWAVEYGRRRGLVKMRYEFIHTSGSRERTFAELYDPNLARVWMPEIVPTLIQNRMASL